MPDLYPPIEPFETGNLAVDARHTLYWEQSGAPNGVPILFLHGGPGAGCTAAHRRFFDPDYYRIVLFDQRGAGRSTPLGELVDNTTQHLIADIEALRRHLGIARWAVFGGSWGSTLALAYAQAHAAQCTALVLRGIFLGTAREVDWFLHGMANVFPDAHRDFIAALPQTTEAGLLADYYRCLTDDDLAVREAAAVAWSIYESRCSTLLPSEDAVDGAARLSLALPLARIEAHYFVNQMFLPDNALLDGIEAIRHIPATIVQGRYDIVCPARSAFVLADAWPEANLVVVPDAGHAAMEPGIRAGLVTATDRLRAKR